MKRILKAILPARAQRLLGTLLRATVECQRFLVDYRHDIASYAKWSGTFRIESKRKALQAFIIRRHHGLEKGLTLNDPRPGFGAHTVNAIVPSLEEYVRLYGFDQQTKIALNVLLCHYEFNLKHGIDDPRLRARLLALEDRVPEELKQEDRGGALTVTRQSLLKASAIDFRSFVNSRHSIRTYDPDMVETKLIEDAVSVAMKSPSVCNRQAVKVYVLADRSVRRKVMSIQNGNRGFGDQPDKILLITSDLQCFKDSRERHEAYVDGGLFAMSLVYALHSLGLGSCCLNLNLNKRDLLTIKKTVGVPASEVLIMLIAVGVIPRELRIASSVRRSLGEVLTVVDETS